MSKASQRREAERRKRLEKKHGAQGAKLLARIEKHGPDAIESCYDVMEFLSEIGPASKVTHGTKRLNSLAHAFRPNVKAVWEQMTCWNEWNGAEYAMEVPCFLAAWDKNDELVGVVPSEHFSREVLEEMGGLEGTTRWLFKTADEKGMESADVVAWVIGGSEEEGFATFCLWATRDGTARVAHVLVEGKWIAARVTDKVWYAAFMSAERASDAFWELPETEKLLKDQGEQLSEGSPGVKCTTEERRRWLAAAVSKDNERHVELWWRLLGAYQAAAEEAELAWASDDEESQAEESALAQARAVGAKEAEGRVKRLETDLAAARQEVEKLKRGVQATAPIVVPASGQQKAKPGPQPEEAADAVMRRVAAFF